MACSKVKDMSLAAFGRKEIELAQVEMPGLMALRKEFGDKKPFKGVKITGSLHMTVQTAVLIETLSELGASIRWCSCNIFSTQDQAAAAIAKAETAAVFAWKGETIEEYWWCTNEALAWDASDSSVGPDLLVDDGGDLTLLIHNGVKAEKLYEANGKSNLDFLNDYSDLDTQHMNLLIRESITKNPTRFRTLASRIVGVSEETTTGVHRLKQMSDAKELLFPAINVNDCVTKSKFDNIYGCRHSLPDGLMRATDVMISGKLVIICGFGDVGKGCAQAMRGQGARVCVTEIDPICALQAAMEGYTVCQLDEYIELADIVITCTGNKHIITVEHLKKMKNNAIVGNIGHFANEIDMDGLLAIPGLENEVIKPQVDRFVFPDTKRGIIVLAQGRLLNLGCATGHPSFVMSCSFTNQVLAQLILWENRNTGKFKPEVYLLPKDLDEKVATYHLPAVGGKLTKLRKDQADYISISVDGPFKGESYRY